MLHFYALPQPLIVALSMISAACVIIQAISLVFNLNRYRVGRIQRAENALEVAILLQTLLLSLLIAQVQSNIQDDLIIPSGYRLLRPMVFTLVLILATSVSYRHRLWWPMLSTLAAALTLPVTETLTGAYFPFLYGLVLGYLLLRSVHICVLRWREQQTSISALSIKEAIDALKTGILFCETDGRIVLINRRMQELIFFLTGEPHRNGREFYAKLTQKQLRQECQADELDGHMVICLPHGTVWMFTDTLLKIKGKSYHQLSAADVTEEWNATARLRQQNAELDYKGQELKQTLANLQAIYREEEALRVKSHIHDILGQRIAILIRSLRENNRPDEALLQAFVQNLSVNLTELSPENTPYQEIDAMIEMFAGIGVTVRLQGALPDQGELSALFVDVITENVTNAVRHGLATEVDIACERKDSLWVLKVTNNGIPPAEPLVEGGGITNMRRRLLGLGGTLQIKSQPRFVLIATLPEGGIP